MFLFGRDYAQKRTDANQGWRETLAQLTEWLRDRVPFCQLRFADGEFLSIVGCEGVNTDGQPYASDTLGVELARVLLEIAALDHTDMPLIVGGDWTPLWREDNRFREYICDNALWEKIPWVPSQVFVTGVEDGSSLPFLRLLIDDPRPKFLVANEKLAPVTRSTGAKLIVVPGKNAWSARAEVERQLRDVPADSIIILCAGMGGKVWGWNAWKNMQARTVIDMGSFFDAACGMKSRSWHTEYRPTCAGRRQKYEDDYVPIIRGNYHAT